MASPSLPHEGSDEGVQGKSEHESVKGAGAGDGQTTPVNEVSTKANTGADAHARGKAEKVRVDKGVVALFTLVVVGSGLGGMTQTALNTMASDVLADLSTDIGWGQWLTTVYIFCMGAAVPLASFVQRRFSVRTLMLASFLLYLVGSLCDFAAINFAMLIIGRVLEAVATGVLMPLLQTIAMTRFPDSMHGTAMGFAGIALGFAPNVGPVLGGAIASSVGWRFLFLILSTASAILVAGTLIIVRDKRAADPQATLDALSLCLSTFGFGGLLFSFTAAANMDLTEPLVWVPLIVGAVCILAFVRRQNHLATPLVNLRIFTFKGYGANLVSQCFLYGCFMGMTLIIPLTVVEAGGHTAFEAGLVMFPGALAALVFEPGAGWLSDKIGARRVALVGGVFLSIGAVFIAFVPHAAPLWVFALLQAVRCMGLTTLIPSTTAAALGPLGKAGLTTDGSATLIMCRQISAALATAVMVFLLKLFAGSDIPGLGYSMALGASGVFALLCLVCVILFVHDEKGTSRD